MFDFLRKRLPSGEGPTASAHFIEADRCLRRGNPDGAVRSIHSAITRLPPNATEADRDRAAQRLSQAGTYFAEQYRWDDALHCHTQAIAFWGQEPPGIQPPDALSTERLTRLAITYEACGFCLYQLARLEEADMHYATSIRLRESLRKRLEPVGTWTTEFRVSLALTYTNHGVMLQAQGRPEAALDAYARSLALWCRLRGDLEASKNWNHALANKLARLHLDRGNTLTALGRLEDALADYNQAVRLREAAREATEPVGSWTADLRDQLAAAKLNQGALLSRLQRYDEAFIATGEAVAIRESVRDILEPAGAWTSDLRSKLARTLNALGNAADVLSRRDIASVAYQGAVSVMQELRQMLEPRGAWGPQQRTDLATTKSNLGSLYYSVGQENQAYIAYEEALSQIETLPDGIWHDTDCLRGSLYANIAASLSHEPAATSWFQRSSQRFTELLEGIAPAALPQSYYAELYNDFAAFHARWFAWCLGSKRVDLIPEILYIIQGREIVAESREQIDRDDSELPAAVRDFRDLRRRLREVNDAIEAAVARGKGLQALMEQHHALVSRLPDLREAAARVSGYEYLGFPRQTLSLAGLQASLAADEALILLIDLPEAECGALVIRRVGDLRWHCTPFLPALARRVRESGSQGARRLGKVRRGIRSGVTASSTAQHPGAPTPTFWQDVAQAMRVNLWAVIASELTGVTRIIAIPHGDLHALPLSAGLPEGLCVSRQPGLVFFSRIPRDRNAADRPVAPVSLIGFAGRNPQTAIPYAEAEAKTLEALYHSHQAPAHRLGGYPSQSTGLLHVACHGTEDPAHPARMALEISPNSVLNQDQILQSSTAPLEVFFNACLAGQTVEGLTGCPSGLIAACFRRGTRWVVGALVETDDRWGLVLALLTHQARIREDLPLPAALREGKRRLEIGDWYEDTAAYLEANLIEPLRQLIEPAARQYWHWAGSRPDGNRVFREGFFPKLAHDTDLEAVWDLDQTDLMALRSELSVHGPTTAAEALAKGLVTRWVSHRPVPPEPELGTLLHGITVFGEYA